VTKGPQGGQGRGLASNAVAGGSVAVYTCHVNNAAGPLPAWLREDWRRTRKILAERGREQSGGPERPREGGGWPRRHFNREAMQKALEKQGITPAHVGSIGRVTRLGLRIGQRVPWPRLTAGLGAIFADP